MPPTVASNVPMNFVVASSTLNSNCSNKMLLINNCKSSSCLNKSLSTNQIPKINSLLTVASTTTSSTSQATTATTSDIGFMNNLNRNNLTNVNHLNCFHQRTRSLPLTEETSIEEFQSPSTTSSSLSSSSLLHSTTAASTSSTSIHNSTLSMVSSTSNSSITGCGVGGNAGTSFINGNAIPIITKLCQIMCTAKNPDGTRQHVTKCGLYHYTLHQMQQQNLMPPPSSTTSSNYVLQNENGNKSFITSTMPLQHKNKLNGHSSQTGSLSSSLSKTPMFSHSLRSMYFVLRFLFLF